MVAFVIVVALNFAYDIASWLLIISIDRSNPSQSQASLALILMKVFIVTYPWQWLKLLLLLGCNVIIAAWGMMLMRLPEDLEIALPPVELIHRQRMLVMRSAYLLYGCLLIIPSLISSLTPGFYYIGSTGFNAVFIVAWLLAAVELLIWVVVSYPRLNPVAQVLIPVGPYLLLRLTALIRSTSTYYHPSFETAKSWLLGNLSYWSPILEMLAIAIIFHLLTRRHVRRVAARAL